MDKIPPIRQLKGRQLGRILIKMGCLTRDKVADALKVQEKRGGKVRLGEILLEQGLITSKDLNVALAGQRGLEYVDTTRIEIKDDLAKQIPTHVVRSYNVVPLSINKANNEITVVMDSPDNFRAIDDITTLTGMTVVAKVTDSEAIQDAIQRYYTEKEESINDLIDEIEGDNVLTTFEGRDKSIDLEELKELAESNPVKKLLNLVLLQAIRDKASDIHFEPFEDEYKMRYRIDGVLYEMVPPP